MATINPIAVTGPGTTGQFLGANTGAAPTWQTPGGGGGGTPNFSVYLSATIGPYTGNGTDFSIDFDQVLFDTASAYNSGNGAYYAPSTGVYLFGFEIMSSGYIVANTESIVTLHVNQFGGGPSFTAAYNNPFTAGGADGNLVQANTCLLSLSAGDYVQVNFGSYGNATANVFVNGGTFNTRFWGYKVA